MNCLWQGGRPSLRARGEATSPCLKICVLGLALSFFCGKVQLEFHDIRIEVAGGFQELAQQHLAIRIRR